MTYSRRLDGFSETLASNRMHDVHGGRGWSPIIDEKRGARIIHTNSFASTASFEDDRPREAPRKRSDRFWETAIGLLAFLFGVLWIGPAVFIVYLNCTGFVIGASAWCPGGRCFAISYYDPLLGTSLTQRNLQNNQQSQSFLNALQFAAKAMELWFLFIATSLIYLVVCVLAKRRGALPIGFLLAYLQYSNIVTFLDKTMWRGHRVLEQRFRERRSNLDIYCFMALSIFLCAISNLIGPSIAIMILPTLRWSETPPLPAQAFNQLLSFASPSGAGAIPGCSADALANYNFTCTNMTYGPLLDQLTDNVISSLAPSVLNTAYIEAQPLPRTAEGDVPFVFNMSVPSNLYDFDDYWVPSRQVIRALTDDFSGFAQVMTGDFVNQTYAPYNNSMSVILQRQGPVFDAEQWPILTSVTVTTVDKGRQIRCYQDMSTDETGNLFTKCFRTGLGWNSTTAITQFSIDREGLTGSKLVTTAFWSDKAGYYGFGKVPPCFANGTLPEGLACDWDTLFADNDLGGQDRDFDVFVYELAFPHSSQPDLVIVSEFFTGFGFSTYTFDASSIWPQLADAQVLNPPALADLMPMVVHPNWLLAAWSVDPYDDISTMRSAAMQLQTVAWLVHEGPPSDAVNGSPDGLFDQYTSVVLYAFLNALSLVAYDASPINSTAEVRSRAHDRLRPVLTLNMQRQAWMYGVNSLTSKLSLVVTCIGILIVLIKTVLSITSRVGNHSTIDLMVAALGHAPRAARSPFDKGTPG